MLESLLIVVLVIGAAVVYNYEESVLTRYIEDHRARLTEEQFEEAKRILMEGGYNDTDAEFIAGHYDEARCEE